jgi:hypothetical protein
VTERDPLPALDDGHRAVIQDALEALESLQDLARPGGPLAGRKATADSLLRVMRLLARECMIETEVGQGPFHGDDESVR